jgi:signal transduction histidine kinase
MPTLVASREDVVVRLRRRDQADRGEELARHLRKSRRDLTEAPARSDDPAIADAAAGGEPIMRDDRIGDRSALTYFLPLRNDRICQECHGSSHKVRGVLVVSVDTSHLQSGLVRSSGVMAASLGLTAVAIGVGLLWSLRRVVLRPIDALVATLRGDEPGRAGERMPPATALEFTTLAHALDDSVERVRTAQAAVVRSEKLAGLGRLAGGIAHDFNNLLMIVSGYSQLLARHPVLDDRGRRYAAVLEDAAERGAMLVRQLLAFSRRQPMAPAVLDLNQVVSGFEPLLRRLIGEHVELTIAPGAQRSRVRADPTQIEQVVMNLVVNARDAMPDGGIVRVETQDVVLDAQAGGVVGLPAGAYVRLSVADNGCGMDAATRAKIFEPFFTTKEPGRGTGLGLATVYGIVKQSDGAIDVESAPGRGTAFRIYLPSVTDVAHVPDRVVPPAAVTGGSETILIAEDDEDLRNLERTVLAAAGYTVLVARDGQEALDVDARHAGTIDLLLTDVVMPRMNGVELAARLVARHPDVRVVYVSGYTETWVPTEGAVMIEKPISPDMLASRVRDVLSARCAS